MTPRPRSLVLMLADVTKDESPLVTWTLWKRMVEERRAYEERRLTVIPARVIPPGSHAVEDDDQ